MHGSFISFIKSELKTCLLFKTSSKVISLLELTVSLVKVICSTRSTYVKVANIEDACITGICTKKTCFENVCTSSIYVKRICTRATSNNSAYVKSVCVIEHSRIHLQSFQILKLEGVRLKIRVGTNCTYIKSACIGQNLEVRSTGLEI